MSTLTLDQFNTLPTAEARALVRGWLACDWWVEQVIAHRPYTSAADVLAAATEFWRQTTPTQQREAFAAHPLIGDVETLRGKFRTTGDAQTDQTADLAHREQGQVLQASEATLQRLAEGNQAYRDRHGFIFIVCASGLSAERMLQALEERLQNDSVVELLNAAIEQERIMQLRLSAAFTTPLDT